MLRTKFYLLGVLPFCVLFLTSMAEEPRIQSSPAKISSHRLKGMKSAIADLEEGIMKQKEYPPLPYSPYHPDFIRLLKVECGVDWESVKSTSDPKDLRDRTDGYNDIMRAEIEHRFGRDIFQKLTARAKDKVKLKTNKPNR